MNVAGRAAAEFVDPACALCGARERTTLFTEPLGPDPGLAELRRAVVRCASCGLVYVTPRRTQDGLITEVYGDDYWRSTAPRERGYADYLADEELYVATFRARWRRLADDLPRSGRALDVGCAAGFAMQALAERGFEVFGVEPSPAIGAAAVRRFGAARVHQGTLADAPFEPRSFSVISMWDVLEHLTDPLAALARARELLEPGGRLVIETQDVESLAARVLGRRWTHFKHDEHLVHFSPRTLALALERSGLALVRATRRDAGKRVSPRFLAERARRVAPWIAWAVAPLAHLPIRSVYVNPFDELIVVARDARG